MEDLSTTGFYIDDDNNAVDMQTGEIIDKKALIKAIKAKRNNDIILTQMELAVLGDDKEVITIKYKSVVYPCKTIKSGYTFGKVFRLDLRKIIEEGKLSINARAFIMTFEPYISFPYNNIIVKMKHPDMATYEKMLGLKKSAIYNILKELEVYEIIKRIKLNGDLIIYFNPYLYSSGGAVYKETQELFKNSKYNPKNYIED